MSAVDCDLQITMTSLEKRALCHLVQDESAYKNWIMIKNKSQADAKSEVIERCLKELVYLHTIPRKIICPDEMYIRNCLELIHMSAGNISFSTSSLNSVFSLEGFVFPMAEEKYEFDAADCFVKCESVNFNSSGSGHWIIGSINGSKSMKNILKHPMLSRVGVLEDQKDELELEFPNSGSRSIRCSPHKLNRFDGMSSVDVSHGMLQCTLMEGKPHYVFSVDEKREVYEASLLSNESSMNECMEWMYSFSLQNGRRKEVASSKELIHVGTMKVSSHFTTCPNGYKILETEFVLYGLEVKTKDESLSDPMSQSFRTKKGLSKKVASTFKPSPSVRKRTKSMFRRSSSVADSCPWSPPTEVHKTHETQLQTYSEIASVIIRKHVNIQAKETAIAEPSGWGASILKKVDHKVRFNVECHQKCRIELCLTTDIIIPAGYHTQPETENGGVIPSSLIQRWKSGGQCDCGGWDIGCPLTIFTTRPNTDPAFRNSSNQNESLSFDTVLKVR